MSLVGPRPIVEKELAKYGKCFATYRRVLPGLTGLWQVSGRNDCSYDNRVELDNKYVASWSLWLDIRILLSTAKTVLSKSGAY
jgi:lipopolysaccharide/colanic/teichoic acid biosynthesis glycosyltransferase